MRLDHLAPHDLRRQTLSCEWRRVGADPVPSWPRFRAPRPSDIRLQTNPLTIVFGCLFLRTFVNSRQALLSRQLRSKQFDLGSTYTSSARHAAPTWPAQRLPMLSFHLEISKTEAAKTRHDLPDLASHRMPRFRVSLGSACELSCAYLNHSRQSRCLQILTSLTCSSRISRKCHLIEPYLVNLTSCIRKCDSQQTATG